MSRMVIEGLNNKTSLNKTKAEIIYELVRSNSSNEKLLTEEVVRRSIRIYDEMINNGIIKEYPYEDPNYPQHNLSKY